VHNSRLPVASRLKGNRSAMIFFVGDRVEEPLLVVLYNCHHYRRSFDFIIHLKAEKNSRLPVLIQTEIQEVY